MKGRKSPRLVVHPRPSPGFNPYPVAYMVGCPTHRYSARRPYPTVVGRRFPRAVLVEVFVSDNIGRNILCGLDSLFGSLARLSPPVEVIRGSSSIHLILSLIASSDDGCLLSLQGEGSGVRSNFGRSGTNGCIILNSVGIRIDTILSGASNGKCLCRSIYFEISVEPAYAYVERALGEPDLDAAVVQIQKFEGSSRAEAECNTGSVDLRTCALIAKNLISNGKRTIDLSVNPLVNPTRFERNRAAEIA